MPAWAGLKLVSAAARSRMRAESFVVKSNSAIATVTRKFHRMSQYVPSKYASDRAFSFAGMVSSQARVAASGSVIPAGVPTGVGEAVVLAVAAEDCCAGKGMEETTRTTLKKARRRVIRELLKDYRRDWKPVPHRVVAVASGRESEAGLQLRGRTPRLAQSCTGPGIRDASWNA